MIAAASAFVLPSIACTLLFRRADSTLQWVGALTLAAPFAIGFSSVAWWGLMHLGIQSQTGLIAADACIWLAAIGVLLWRRLPVPARQRAVLALDRTSWIVLATLVVLLIAVCVSFLAAAIVMPHGEWDAWAIWNLRARFLFRAAPSSWRDAFSPLLFWSHLDYPLLLPLAVSRGWTYAHREGSAIPIAIAAIFAISTVMIAGLSVAGARSSSRGALTAAAILTCPAFLRCAPSQCADIPLAFYVLASILLLSRAFESPSNRVAWLLAGASTGLAAWTKNEGILFLVACFSMVAIRTIRADGRVGLKYAACLLAGALPMIIAVMLVKAGAPENDLLQAQAPRSVINAFGDAVRLQAVVTAIGQELWLGGATTVGVLPIVALFMAVNGLRPASNPAPLIGFATIGLVIAGYATAYVVTPHDLAWHLRTSLERVILHVFPAFVWCGMMVAKE
jgi:hypothetical protein